MKQINLAELDYGFNLVNENFSIEIEGQTITGRKGDYILKSEETAVLIDKEEMDNAKSEYRLAGRTGRRGDKRSEETIDIYTSQDRKN